MSGAGYSIIIPTFNGAEKIERLLRSLERVTLKGGEIIFVVDGSTDNTIEIINDSSLRERIEVITQPNAGRASSRNKGAFEAKGETLIFFDDDILASQEIVALHLQHHQVSSETILVGNLLEDLPDACPQTDVQKYKARLSRKWMNELGTEKGRLSRPFITAAHFSMPKNLFESLGGFNENLRDCEDYELALRATQAGIPIYFDPGIVAWHGDSITAHSYAQRLIEYKKAFEKVAELHDLPGKTSHNWKSIVYFFFSFRFWLTTIDREVFGWLPEKLRYKLYDIIFHSHSIFS